MKSDEHVEKLLTLKVAPFAGAWIEIERLVDINDIQEVAPFAGAWIEIQIPPLQAALNASLPSRERGLKLVSLRLLRLKWGRSLRGSVD